MINLFVLFGIFLIPEGICYLNLPRPAMISFNACNRLNLFAKILLSKKKFCWKKESLIIIIHTWYLLFAIFQFFILHLHFCFESKVNDQSFIFFILH